MRVDATRKALSFLSWSPCDQWYERGRGQVWVSSQYVRDGGKGRGCFITCMKQDEFVVVYFWYDEKYLHMSHNS